MEKDRRLNEDEILEYINNCESFENLNNRSMEHIIETIVYNFGCESEIAYDVAKKLKKQK